MLLISIILMTLGSRARRGTHDRTRRAERRVGTTWYTVSVVYFGAVMLAKNKTCAQAAFTNR